MGEANAGNQDIRQIRRAGPRNEIGLRAYRITDRLADLSILQYGFGNHRMPFVDKSAIQHSRTRRALLR